MNTSSRTSELSTLMEPLFREAESTGKWFCDLHGDGEFSAKHLRHLQSQGEWCRGPGWWKLIPRPNFTLHQGEWDTITVKEHNQLRREALQVLLQSAEASVVSLEAEIRALGPK